MRSLTSRSTSLRTGAPSPRPFLAASFVFGGVAIVCYSATVMDDKKDTTDMSSVSTPAPVKPWRFVTNHTQVLLCIARDSDVRLKTIAESVGITERAAQR